MPDDSSMTDLFSMTDDLPSMTEASSMTDAQNTGREPTMSRTARRVLMAGIIAAVGGTATAAPAVDGVNISPSHELAQGVGQIRSWGATSTIASPRTSATFASNPFIHRSLGKLARVDFRIPSREIFSDHIRA